MSSSFLTIQQESSDPADEASSSSDAEGSDSNCEESLESLVDESKEEMDGDEVNIGELLDSFESRGFGPLLLIPALISISPLGTIPGMSIVTGSLIFVIATQMIFRSDHPWIPKRLEEISFSRERYDKTIDKMTPWIKWIDHWVCDRWGFMTVGPMHYVVAAVMILLSLTYYPLAVVPFGVLLPGTAMAFFALGITMRDGYLVTLGLVAACGAAYGMLALWPF
ncbi:exopolysaccharide biosynthesis protein [Thalassoglobus polymorphus]|uniref:Exopolysaccharide synthesis, ExoD n=1 Tax=Thalassoglobus polymorphus TaxID=2527994 RepID=A0A517QV72_9PLAN|nr:exopolysaccharide biosynthesis protein [Thalassoglobus polymorphus]QDT35520.1 Exopolysaccharide synthesis, ExoD [Thalassoglobus polymorphus]